MIKHRVISWFVLVMFGLLLMGCDSSSSIANRAPIAKSKTVQVEQNKPRDIGLGGEDADNDDLTVIITKSPLHGSIKNNVYTPEKDFYGVDELRFKVTDGELESQEVIVTINIVDLTAPSVVITPANTSLIETTSELAYFSIKVSEPIKKEVLLEDLYVDGGVIHHLEGSMGVYTLVVTPNKNSDIPITVLVPAGKLEDLSGNLNEESNISVRNVDTQRAFITVWQTDNEGVSGDKQLEINSQPGAYNYVIDWGDGKVEKITKQKVRHSYSSAGIYKVKIKGDFPGLYFGKFTDSTDAKKLLKVTQWGSIIWSSMEYAFSGCSVMVGDFSDVPDMTEVTKMNFMFTGASVFNSDISLWDVSSVEYMTGLFSGAGRYNKALTAWDTSGVKDMSSMFLNAIAFNSSVESWDTSQVKSFYSMFKGAKKFNHRLNSWDTSSVVHMANMFYGAASFNQSIGKWDTRKVTSMEGMFKKAVVFDKDITTWSTVKVVTTKRMFESARKFNQDISTWNMGQNKYMNEMFLGASKFNQDLSAWDVSSAKSMNDMFYGASMSEENLKKLTALWPLL